MPHDTTVKSASQKKKSTSSCWLPSDLGRGKTKRKQNGKEWGKKDLARK